jgi:phenylalanyl-tRNA synthetase beta chain
VGAKLKSAAKGGEPVTIGHMTFRGEESNGMICAAEELGLEDRYPPKPEEGARPILDLTSFGFSPGMPLSEALGMNDVVFHIDNHAITNRPDLFSHIGFARECVALGLATWKKTKAPKLPAFPKASLPFEVILEQKSLLPRYLGCSIVIGALGETPVWMKKRLEALGARSLSLPIDITNYVMMEYGVPLHSFDADDLKGDVHIRASMEGDTVTTLDEVERTLPAGAVVIHDDQGIFDLLPIMGGLRSSTKPTTRHIYLQSVSADPVAVRAGIIGTGLRTEAATVSEKGIPPVRVKEAFYRALELFLTLVPGAKITSKLVSWGTDGAPKPITFSYKDAERALGVAIPEKMSKKILTDLGFKVSRNSVTPPLWRIKDVTGPHDLAEEVGRIYGYDKIPSSLPTATIEPPPRDQRLHALRDDLKEAGFIEVLPLSLLGPDLLTACRLDPHDAIEVENALGEELSLMQTSTLPRLLEHAGRNMLSVEKELRTFECSHVFNKREGEWLECGMLIAERKGGKLKETPFLELKQVLLEELRGSGFAVELRATEKIPFGHPGRSADLLVGGKAVGMVFEVHPQVAAAFDLPGKAAAALLDLTSLLEEHAPAAVMQPVPQFPAITYDLTVTLDASRSAAELVRKIRSSSPILEEVAVADLYDGSPLKKGQYNLTVRCTYRAKDRTLTEEEVKREHGKVEALVRA